MGVGNELGSYWVQTRAWSMPGSQPQGLKDGGGSWVGLGGDWG